MRLTFFNESHAHYAFLLYILQYFIISANMVEKKNCSEPHSYVEKKSLTLQLFRMITSKRNIIHALRVQWIVHTKQTRAPYFFYFIMDVDPTKQLNNNG